MPILECLIERDGPTTINDGGFKFVFEKNEEGRAVCNVLSEGTARRLLNFEWFQLYEPEEEKDSEQAPSEKEAIDQRILILRGEGYSLRAIGEAVGRSATHVSKIIKERSE